MSQTPDQPGDPRPSGEAPRFDPNAPNQQRPKLRPIRGFPARNGEQMMLGLMDAQQISQKIVFAMPAAQVILPHMDGRNDLDAIVQRVGKGLTREALEMFVAQLDDAGLIEGPTFERLRHEMHEEYDSKDNLPPGATAQLADALAAEELGKDAAEEQVREVGATKLRERMDKWIEEALRDAQDPSFNELPSAVVAPHLDYARGWNNYAQVYGRMRVVDRPVRVIILGTNHFGSGTGVVGCDKGFETPFGVSPVAQDVMHALDQALSEEDRAKLYANRYDHEREHSIELHVPWIQHVFGDDADDLPAVWAALVHDPVRNAGESYDGQGLGLAPFVAALRKVVSELPGKTLVVASVDLSHIGPQFGDQAAIKEEDPKGVALRDQALANDRDMLKLVEQGKLEELSAAMAWRRNPTRWCSVGALMAAHGAVQPESVRILNYAAAADPQGAAFISSCAAVMM